MIGLILVFNTCKKEEQILKPKACFNYSSDTEIRVEDTIKFSNCSENATKFTWDFGDGTTSTDTLPTHVYKNRGSFIVKLETLNNNLNDTISKTILIKDKQYIIGVKETTGITTVFTPIVVEEDYYTSNIPKRIAFNGIDYFIFSKNFSVSHGDYKEHHIQTISTLNGCTIHSLNGIPYIHALNDIVNVKNAEMYIGIRMKTDSGYKFGWMMVNEISRENMFFISYAMEK